MTTLEIDWAALKAAAVAAMGNAYAPYSKFPVGAAALVDDGRIVAGCNVENASYGVGLCAECALVSGLHMSGGGKLVAFSCVDGNGAALMPCGRCRQLLYEHSAPGMLLATVSGIRTIDEVLPDAFGPRQLVEYGATETSATEHGATATSATETSAPETSATETSATETSAPEQRGSEHRAPAHVIDDPATDARG